MTYFAHGATWKENVGYNVMGTRTQFYIEWKIKEYLKVKQEQYKEDITWVVSPKFDFLESTCCFRILLRGEPEDEPSSKEYCIGLFLKNRRPPEPYYLSGTFGVKANNGRIYKCNEFIATFKFSFRATDIVISNLPNEDILDADGTATFFCSINHPEFNVIDAVCQTSEHDDVSDENKKIGVIFDDGDVDVLRQSISGMLTKEQYYDVILKVDENEFKAHKGVLAARSQVFASMFEHDMMESKNGIVNIEDCDKDVFHDFLQYIYSAEVESITTNKMLSLYCIADKYDVKELKKSSLKFLLQNPSVDRFGDTIELALKYDEKELIEACKTFFAQNAERILVTVNWRLFAEKNFTAANEFFIWYAKRNK